MRMKLVLRLVATGVDGSSRSVDVQEIVSRSDPGDIAALGVTLSQGKQLLALVQREVVAAQCRDHAMRRPPCRWCAAVCQVTLRLPRFRCAGMEAGQGWPAHCRSTPELDQVRAQFSAGALEQLLAIDAGIDPEPLRACTFKVDAALVDTTATDPAVAASAIILTLDSTFIRSCEKDQRHLEVRLGNVEAS